MVWPFKNSGLPFKIWILALISFINAVSFTILIPILYPYAKQFGLSDFHASLLTTSYALSLFVATPIIGRLSDSWGRKKLLILCLLGTVASNIWASLATVPAMFYAARILDGLTGGNTSIANAIVVDISSPQDRAQAFGLLDASFRMGFVTGPAISFLSQSLPTFPGVTSLGMSFLASAVIAFVASILSLFFLPETLKQKREIKLNLGIFGLGAIAKSLRRSKVGNLLWLTLFSGFTFTIFTFALQPFFINVLGQDARSLAALLTLVGFSGVVMQLVGVAPVTRRFPLTRILVVIFIIRASIFLIIPLSHLELFVVGGILLGMINAYPLPILSTLLSIHSGPKEQGEIQGVKASILGFSNAFGPAFSGLLVSEGYRVPFVVAGLLTLLTAGFANKLAYLDKTPTASP
ncbi:MAG: MFS transporter [Cyanobacteria bacterium P01_H01_bin.15]